MNWTTRKRNGLIYRTAIAGEFRAVITQRAADLASSWWQLYRNGHLAYQGSEPTIEASQARILAHLDQYATA